MLAATTSAFGGPISITITPSIAPNAFGGAGWPGYVANAVTAIETFQLTNGDPSLPSYYAAQTVPLMPFDLIVTGFPSWHAQADPGTVFGPAFANEYGNRVHFGLDINGNGTQFSISQLSFTETSNDAGNGLGFSFGTGSYAYSSNYVGIIYGPGGPTYVTSGSNTQMVDRLVGRGSGNAFAAACSGCTVAQQQAAILALLPSFAGMTQLTGTYTLTQGNGQVLASGSGSIEVTGAVPEPGTMWPLTGGMLVACLLIRRKR